MSAEIPNSQGHAVDWAEANMWVYRYGEISHTVAASDWNRSCHTIIKRRLERACKTHISRDSVWAIMYKIARLAEIRLAGFWMQTSADSLIILTMNG